MVFDVETIGMGLTSAAGIAALVWGWIQKQRSVVSETKARVAEDDGICP